MVVLAFFLNPPKTNNVGVQGIINGFTNTLGHPWSTGLEGFSTIR